MFVKSNGILIRKSTISFQEVNYVVLTRQYWQLILGELIVFSAFIMFTPIMLTHIMFIRHIRAYANLELRSRKVAGIVSIGASILFGTLTRRNFNSPQHIMHFKSLYKKSRTPFKYKFHFKKTRINSLKFDTYRKTDVVKDLVSNPLTFHLKQAFRLTDTRVHLRKRLND